MTVRWTKGAAAGLGGIYDHIAADDPAAAKRVVERILSVVDTIGAHPRMGRLYRPPNVHLLPVAGLPYLISYRVSGGTVTIIRIFHGARQRP